MDARPVTRQPAYAALAFLALSLGLASARAALPDAVTGVATAVTTTGATLNGTVNDNGELTAVAFDFGTTASYGSSAAATPASLAPGSGLTAVSAVLPGLACNTTYHFRVSAANGTGTAHGSDATFTTAACATGPAVTTNAATAIDAIGATLNGTVRDAGLNVSAIVFDYGATTAYGSTGLASPSTLTATPGAPATASVAWTIGGLSCGTTYHFRLRATDANATISGVDRTFATPACTQSIAFGALSAKVLGAAPFAVSATATSGLAVAFSSLTPAVCTVSGTTVTVVSVGTCSVAADQAGDATYAAAPRVTQSFTVTAGLGESGQVAAGYDHTCVLAPAGTVACWGANDGGQLGDGTTVAKSVPTPVTGLTGVVAIAAGGRHTCAVTGAGALMCWGANASGQVGDGTAVDRLVPTAVPSLATGVVGVALGMEHSCAVTTAGAVKCWGLNAAGQLGDGTAVNRAAPVAVTDLASGALSVAAGGMHTCAVKSDGTAACWGAGLFGQLGQGSTASSAVPVAVPGLAGVASLALGWQHGCALLSGGAVKCWGRNLHGEVGDASATLRNAPVAVTGLTATSLAAGGSHTCAVTSAGAVQCWGFNGYGQLGDGTSVDRNVPTAATGLGSGLAAVTAGYWHACARSAVGDLHCWGANDLGQLGEGTTVDRPVAVRLDGPARTGQSIVFAVPAGFTYGTPATLAGSATSALAVAFDSWTPLVCTVSGATVTMVSPGLCGVRARQAGNGSYAAAPPVLRVVPVTLVPEADSDSDGIPNAVELVEGHNPLLKDNDIFSAGAGPARDFAMQQYRDFLGREGDAAGITAWTDALVAGTFTRLQVIDAFLGSAEFGGTMAPVARLYFATFLRVPDYAGLAYNAAQVRAGAVTLVQLADFFTASPEFQSLYGSLDNTQFVTLLYNNVLGRAPDQAGLDGWVAQLAGGLTRGQVLLGFSDSPEYQAAMANEVFVTMMYAGMLRRTPETAGFSGWVSALDAGSATRTQVIDGFYQSSEYRARFVP